MADVGSLIGGDALGKLGRALLILTLLRFVSGEAVARLS